jgi:hypothetical protein
VIRRDFLLALSGAAFAWPVVAAAQQPTGIPRVGVLMGSSPSVEKPTLTIFREGLEKLGYIDGQNVQIEPRYAMGEPDRFTGCWVRRRPRWNRVVAVKDVDTFLLGEVHIRILGRPVVDTPRRLGILPIDAGALS